VRVFGLERACLFQQVLDAIPIRVALRGAVEPSQGRVVGEVWTVIVVELMLADVVEHVGFCVPS
jgi:hypothetical protein